MKIIVDIPDNKASFFMEVLKNFSFVKSQTITDTEYESVAKDLKNSLAELDSDEATFVTIDELDDLLEKSIKKYGN